MDRLESALCSSDGLIAFVLPLMVEKISSSDVATDGKLDSMSVITRMCSNTRTQMTVLSNSVASASSVSATDLAQVVLKPLEPWIPSLSRLSELLYEIITAGASDAGKKKLLITCMLY